MGNPFYYMSMIQLLILIICFIFLSGIMAMVDAAVLSISAAEIESMVQEKKRGAVPLKKIFTNISRAVVIIVAFTNTINIFGPILIGQTAARIYGSTVIGVITAVLTFGTIIFSEIIPKSLGVHYAPAISRTAAPVILFFTYALFPLVRFLEWFSKLMQRGTRRVGTEEQIKALVKLGSASGYIEKDESRLIRRAFVLDDTPAEAIMTPLEKVTGISEVTTIREAVETLKEKRYSRFPVYSESPKNITGYVLSKDIYELAAAGKWRQQIGTICDSIPVVNAEKTTDTLLVYFRQIRTHIAIVKKSSTTIGIVTLEDVIEELVGEIEDEKD